MVQRSRNPFHGSILEMSNTLPNNQCRCGLGGRGSVCLFCRALLMTVPTTKARKKSDSVVHMRSSNGLSDRARLIKRLSKESAYPLYQRKDAWFDRRVRVSSMKCFQVRSFRIFQMMALDDPPSCTSSDSKGLKTPSLPQRVSSRHSLQSGQ